MQDISSRIPVVLAAIFCMVAGGATSNNRPTIGVLLQETTDVFAVNGTYVAASYVKFVEAGGAQVVPIFLNKPSTYYEEVLSSLNGVLFPGGAVDIGTSGYAKAGKIIFEYAKQRNQLGDYFPLWGTCNGFEMMAYLYAGNQNPLTACNSQNTPNNLDFEPGAFSSKLFRGAPEPLRKDMMFRNVTVNYHEWCLTKKNFTKFGLHNQVKILSMNKDSNGLEFVSSFEDKQFPFYAVQFHPEKNVYEWGTREGHNAMPHTAEAIRTANYFSQFFVNEARRSNHTATNAVLTDLIYNFPVNATQNTTFTQTYFFD